MKNRTKNREAFKSQHSYWQSYSDMMAALLLIFVLIIAITLAIYKQKTTDLDKARGELAHTQSTLDIAQQELNSAMADLELARAELDEAQKDLDAAREDLEGYRIAIEHSNEELQKSLAELQKAYDEAALTQEELNKAYLEIENGQKELASTKQELQNIVGVRTDIIGALQSAFNNSSMSVDAQTGSITFSSDVLFSYNSATLTTVSKDTLKDLIPKYLDVLMQDQYSDYIAEIIIEGHTDTDGSYESNMTLSYNRAWAVAQFCLDKNNGLDEMKIAQLKELLTVNGKSYSQPIYVTDALGNQSEVVNMEASRRVEIKFRLKEDEMIEKISDVLKQ